MGDKRLIGIGLIFLLFFLFVFSILFFSPKEEIPSICTEDFENQYYNALQNENSSFCLDYIEDYVLENCPSKIDELNKRECLFSLVESSNDPFHCLNFETSYLFNLCLQKVSSLNNSQCESIVDTLELNENYLGNSGAGLEMEESICKIFVAKLEGNSSYCEIKYGDHITYFQLCDSYFEN